MQSNLGVSGVLSRCRRFLTLFCPIFLIGLLGLSGCLRPFLLKRHQVQNEFEQIDALEVWGELIRDSETIRGLKEIHARANWDPVPFTMPADVIAVYGLKNQKKSFKLLLGAGWIMDTNEHGEVTRCARIRETDHEWLEKHIRSRLATEYTVQHGGVI